MKKPTVPIFPVLDKSHLFVHLPTDPQNQSTRYLQCPATGHLYCMSTGSLYRKIPIIPVSTNILSLRQGKDSCLLHSIPPPFQIKMVSVDTKNIDQQDIGSSTTASIESNMSPKAAAVDKAIEGYSAPATQKNKASNVKNADLHIQDIGASTILSTHSNITADIIYRDQPIHGITTSITPNTHRNEAFENKPDMSAQISTPVPGANSSAFILGNFEATTKGKKKIRRRKVKTKSPLLEHSGASSKKKSASSKQKKSAVPPEPKLTTTLLNNSRDFKNTAVITQTTKKCKKATIHSNNSLSTKKGKSFTYSQFHLHHMIKPIQPIHFNFQDIFPQNTSATRNLPKFSRKREENTPIVPVCSLSKSRYKCARRNTKRKKPSLHLITEDFLEICLQNNFKKKTARKKTRRHVSDSFKSVWAFLKPFNRRRYPYRNRQKSLEEEAIHRYKKMNLEKHNQRLKVQEYDVLHHTEKSYLACLSRSVINVKDKKSWPILVKCLHKHPDSTLRQACKHPTFCLRWNGASYTLRKDHAYYTEIQCHMAVTDMSYAELIVHTHKETTILPVYFDSDFWKQTEATLETFFTGNILPYLKKTEMESNVFRATSVSNNTNDEIEE